jgi:tetratricopeptide (TPR) repeat protein
MAGIHQNTESLLRGQAEQATKVDIRALEATINKALADKTPGSPSNQPPSVDPAALAAAETVQHSPEASLLARVEAAVLRRSPEALEGLAQLDQLAGLAEYRRHELRGDYHYFRGEYDLAITPYETALNLRPDDLNARNNVAIAHIRAQQGDPTNHKHRAIEILRDMLARVRPMSRDWAGTQNNIGTAWEQMPTGNRAQNLIHAEEAYQAALSVFKRETYSMHWAMALNNVGNVWRQKNTAEMSENFARAINAYEMALTVYKKEDYPMEWAMTQNNLGVALSETPQNLARAIEAFDGVLTVYTKSAHPHDWAATKNNLGAAWAEMPPHGDPQNLSRAFEAFYAALTVHTKDLNPVDWAATHANLGKAFYALRSGDRAQNLARSKEAYNEALSVRTKNSRPLEWAETQGNFAVTVAALAELPGQARCTLLRQAISSGKGALTVCTPEVMPTSHERMLHNLLIDRRAYEAAGCTAEMPFDAIPAAE